MPDPFSFAKILSTSPTSCKHTWLLNNQEVQSEPGDGCSPIGDNCY